MSPARSRKQFVASRPRAELYTAVGVGTAIVVGALLLIWLIRPGPVGIPGKGGLLARQPRMTLLFVLAIAALGGWAAYILRRRKDPPLGRRNALALGGIVLVALAIIGGVLWPGGVIRHWPKSPTIAETPETIPASVPSSAPATTPTTAKTGTSVSTPSTAARTPTTAASTPTTATSPTTKAG